LIGLKLLGILAFVGDRPNYWDRFGLSIFILRIVSLSISEVLFFAQTKEKYPKENCP